MLEINKCYKTLYSYIKVLKIKDLDPKRMLLEVENVYLDDKGNISYGKVNIEYDIDYDIDVYQEISLEVFNKKRSELIEKLF
jgi:hypothetical protein